MTRRSRLLVALSVATSLIMATVEHTSAETLQEYARKCDQAIGVTVPDFDCDGGTLIPTTNFQNGSCDRPNRLNRECDPDSWFTVLTRSPSADVVALCRKKGAGAGQYRDIAVIQYSKVDGSTCFYQALADDFNDLNGQVKAPSKGQSAWPWLPPTGTASIQCFKCHDNGPLIRSPYLTQITGPNALPGAGENTYNNRDQPYRFIGEAFTSWKTYQVEVDRNLCNDCHRMGTNNVLVDGRGQPHSPGTALDFGIRATAADGFERNKNPHSPTSPIWMIPNQITFSQSSAEAANAIRNCASQRAQNPLPNTLDCKITQVSTTESDTGSVPPSASYEQAAQILSTYLRLLGRPPTDAQYRRALVFLLNGGSQTALDAIVLSQRYSYNGDGITDLFLYHTQSGSTEIRYGLAAEAALKFVPATQDTWSLGYTLMGAPKSEY